MTDGFCGIDGLRKDTAGPKKKYEQGTGPEHAISILNAHAIYTKESLWNVNESRWRVRWFG